MVGLNDGGVGNDTGGFVGLAGLAVGSGSQRTWVGRRLIRAVWVGSEVAVAVGLGCGVRVGVSVGWWRINGKLR